MKKNTFKKLNKYVAASAAALATGLTADAAIIYTPAVNDMLSGFSDVTTIDLDGGGTPDFRLNQSGYSYPTYVGTYSTYGPYRSYRAGLGAYGSNSVLKSSYRLIANSPGASISNAASSWINQSSSNSYNLGGNSSSGSGFNSTGWGSFPGNGDNYAGVRFYIGTDLHYGWIKLNQSLDAGMVTIVDYAYESCPGVAIKAGETTNSLCGPTTVNTNEDITACDSAIINTNTYFTTQAVADTFVAGAASGADSIHTTNLTINNTVNTSESITACDSVDINGTTYYSSQTVMDTLAAITTCDSIHTTNLTINISGAYTADPIDVTVCTGEVVGFGFDYAGNADSFDWQISNDGGSTWASLANNSDTISGAVGISNDGNLIRNVAYNCGNITDSTTEAMFTVNPLVVTSEDITACDSATINGTTYYATQTVNDLMSGGASTGCDSTHTTNLTINNAVNTFEDITACDSATVNGTTYTSSQVVLDTFTAITTCDSIHTTNLTINNPVNTTEDKTACNTATINGNVYTTSQTIMDTLTGVNTCDSIHTTNLTISTVYTIESYDFSGCDSVMAFGTMYNASESLSDTIIGGSIGGCDSITITNVIVNTPSNSSEMLTTCAPAIINGNSYSTTQMITDTLLGASATGCDSIHVTDLTISSFVQVSYDFVDCDSVSAFGTMYYTSVSMNDTTAGASCDSITTTNIIVNSSVTTNETANINEGESIMLGGASQTAAGTYYDSLMTAEGCDSVIATVLTVNPDGIMYGDKLNIKVYPNPSTGLFSLDLSGMKSEQVDYIITDNTGRIVKSEVNVLSSNVKNIDLSSATDGVYFLQVRSKDVSTIVKLVKN